jgi:hypothetical protein
MAGPIELKKTGSVAMMLTLWRVGLTLAAVERHKYLLCVLLGRMSLPTI